ncbi:hypothetical protein YC2023_061186 [Brassica napus]
MAFANRVQSSSSYGARATPTRIFYLNTNVSIFTDENALRASSHIGNISHKESVHVSQLNRPMESCVFAVSRGDWAVFFTRSVSCKIWPKSPVQKKPYKASMVGGVTPEILYAETPLTLHYSCFVLADVFEIVILRLRFWAARNVKRSPLDAQAAITHSMNDAGILMNVQFLRRAKITGKKVMAGLIFARPLDATLRRRRSDRG